MIQYLTVLLDDQSVSFCHYDNLNAMPNLIDKDTLKENLIWAMKENVNVQFVYPNYHLPNEYEDLIDMVDSTKIKNFGADADVIVVEDWNAIRNISIAEDTIYIVKTSRDDLKKHLEKFNHLLSKSSRVNVVYTDTLSFDDREIEEYEQTLRHICNSIVNKYQKGRFVQLNILTDRILLGEMNNCDAGVKSITLAPNGKFYLCPAFYYDNPESNVGDCKDGITIKNQQLLKLDHAPLCRLCDAYHCKRCVWMNMHSTLDINTPSHQQCVIAHIERNASLYLLEQFDKNGIMLSDAKPFKKIDYLDPFNKYSTWK